MISIQLKQANKYCSGPLQQILLLIALLCSAALYSNSVDAASDLRTQKLKAAFLYNFARYTEWSELPSNQVRFCIIGSKEFSNIVKKTLKRKKVHQRRIIVERLSVSKVDKSCQLIYIEDGYSVFSMRSNHPKQILTIGEGESFAKKYGLVGFFEQGNRLKFAVNLNRSRQTGLRISARLLHLAKIVE